MPAKFHIIVQWQNNHLRYTHFFHLQKFRSGMESFLYIISCLLLEIVWRYILLITNHAKFACVCNVDFEVLPYQQKVWFSTRNFWIAMFPVKVLNKPSVLFFCLFACFAFFCLCFYFIKFLDSLAHKVLETLLLNENQNCRC